MMRRREFIALLGGAAAAWPLAARAQQPAMPVIGLLDAASPKRRRPSARISPGPEGQGHVEGENVAIVYRWAESRIDRLPALAADLIRRRVSRDRAPEPRAAIAAKAATTTIPIVFVVAEDPVEARSGRQPCPAGRQRDRNQFFRTRVGCKAAGAPARAGACGRSRCRARRSGQCGEYRVHTARRGTGCSRHGTASPGLQGQHQPRDRCGFRKSCARRPDALFVAATPFSPAGVSNWSTSRRAMQFPRHIRRVNLPKSAG